MNCDWLIISKEPPSLDQIEQISPDISNQSYLAVSRFTRGLGALVASWKYAQSAKKQT